MNLATDVLKIPASLIAMFLLIGRMSFSMFDTYCFGRAISFPSCTCVILLFCRYILKFLPGVSLAFVRPVPVRLKDVNQFVVTLRILNKPHALPVLLLQYCDKAGRNLTFECES